MQDFNIDIGKAEVLTLAIQENAGIIATDDRNTIRACKFLRKDFITAITVLMMSLEKKIIDREEALIKLGKLQSFGRYSKPIIEDATKRIKGDI
ncbi:MAG: hypothetical protein A2161_09590 [Candidatus Schekmanbacteria bacterium RBG_13_48_7]|uniref:DUF3368 domain-containing protein n=1 Tax=Candidatus Schekmanbacteria bacterium RBG_13_48_7 TaxID=1817878 RepID=A0A1F7RQ16_9BACT|nr:MAG: hypothetical protein A2161_09590 [Candidatus Schekmanbacteria bacterium RBG_13_48_7]